MAIGSSSASHTGCAATHGNDRLGGTRGDGTVVYGETPLLERLGRLALLETPMPEEGGKQVGVVLAGPTAQPHKILINMDHCGRVVFGAEGNASEGPDLGFLVLPPDTAGTLKAKKTFYNLTLRRKRMLETPEPLEAGGWVLSGFGAEWTEDDAAPRGFERVKRFKGMHGIGRVVKEEKRGAFDYVAYEVLYNEVYEGPESYGGFSGGALWQIFVKPNCDRWQVVDRLLSGVAFFQSGKQTDAGGQGTKEITCRGRNSVYLALIDAVRALKAS